MGNQTHNNLNMSNVMAIFVVSKKVLGKSYKKEEAICI